MAPKSDTWVTCGFLLELPTRKVFLQKRQMWDEAHGHPRAGCAGSKSKSRSSSPTKQPVLRERHRWELPLCVDAAVWGGAGVVLWGSPGAALATALRVMVSGAPLPLVAVMTTAAASVAYNSEEASSDLVGCARTRKPGRRIFQRCFRHLQTHQKNMSNRSTEMIYATSSDVSIVTFTILSIVAIATNPAARKAGDAAGGASLACLKACTKATKAVSGVTMEVVLAPARILWWTAQCARFGNKKPPPASPNRSAKKWKVAQDVKCTAPAVAAFKDAYQNVVKAQQVLAAWEGPQYAAPTVCQYLKSNAQLEKRKDILRSTVPDNRDGFSDLSIHPEDPTGSLPTYQAVLKKHGKDMTKVVSFEEKMERAFKL
ncbi:hypothetical protein CYMTET_8617 [Cymbomonas tetramitiformis]|uniref:Uncharacterized protein n=1 Tax=Cymbomonas tetramitiformis TaxID=36881 RepID=A0AAE0LGB9_9CHLO|nr:hypothetical protein CYMTET_8617 [Cymbomonas tetramitiformis]